jgi:hypothetical protein
MIASEGIAELSTLSEGTFDKRFGGTCRNASDVACTEWQEMVLRQLIERHGFGSHSSIGTRELAAI